MGILPLRPFRRFVGHNQGCHDFANDKWIIHEWINTDAWKSQARSQAGYEDSCCFFNKVSKCHVTLWKVTAARWGMRYKGVFFIILWHTGLSLKRSKAQCHATYHSTLMSTWYLSYDDNKTDGPYLARVLEEFCGYWLPKLDVLSGHLFTNGKTSYGKIWR